MARVHSHNANKWPLKLQNAGRQFAAFRDVDVLNPSHRPAAKKAAKQYVESAKAAKAAKEGPGYVAAVKKGSAASAFLRNTGGTPTGVYRTVNENGSEHGTWNGIHV